MPGSGTAPIWERAPRGRWWLLAAVIVVLGAALYHPVRHFAFLNFDDDAFITQNPWLAMGLTWESLHWALFANLTVYSTSAEYWSPITLLSRLLEAHFFGMHAGPFHVTSALLHLLNALLLAVAAWRLTGHWGRSAVVALLFLVHPQHVEPVCWLSARKDLLSATFFFLTLLAYAHYVQAQNGRRYALLVLAFLGGLMAKPMVVSVPFVLLILDFWPLNRWRPWSTGRQENLRIVAEKMPLLILAGLGAALAVVSQQDWNAIGADARYPLPTRLANAAIGYLTYLRRLFWPDDLAIFYPHRGVDLSLTHGAFAAAALAAITIGLWRLRRSHPYLLAGWFWFGVVLGPVIGLVQIGGQAMADRYAYPALIGLYLALVWLAGERLPPLLARILAVLAIGAFSVVTARQVPTWKNTITVFTHALKVTRENAAAHLNLGCALLDEGDLLRAREEFQKALAISPRSGLGWNNLARTEALLGNEEAAVRTYLKVLQVDPDQKQTLLFLGRLLKKRGRLEHAQRLFERLRELAPHLPQPYFELGEIHAARGELGPAREAWEKYLQIRPEDEALRKRLAELRAPPPPL
jgi:Tfp pilus assembly protein PilF